MAILGDPKDLYFKNMPGYDYDFSPFIEKIESLRETNPFAYDPASEMAQMMYGIGWLDKLLTEGATLSYEFDYTDETSYRVEMYKKADKLFQQIIVEVWEFNEETEQLVCRFRLNCICYAHALETYYLVSQSTFLIEKYKGAILADGEDSYKTFAIMQNFLVEE